MADEAASIVRPAYPVYIIRHGETDWNRESRFQGRTDIALNDLGREQASGNGARLAQLQNDFSSWHFFASPLSRTRETMERLRASMGLEPSKYALDDALIEVTFGDWEGSTLDELQAQRPQEFATRDASKWDYVPPNGESYAQAAGRMRFVLDGLPGPSVLVTHGGMIRAARHLIEGLEPNEAASGMIPQDRIYFFDGETGRWLP